ncbi:hypothetical protein CC79DRAFT_1329650 [Sarocladium strictum]
MAPQLVAGDDRQKDTVIFWLAIALILVSVAFISTITALTIKWIIRRQRRYQEVDEQDATKSQPTRSKWVVGRTRSLEDKVEEEETQREYMIRKSYASRASLRTSSQYSADADVEAGAGDAPAVPAKDDTNGWEAKFQAEQRQLPDNHSGFLRPAPEAIQLREPSPPTATHSVFTPRVRSGTSTPRLEPYVGAQDYGRSPPKQTSYWV